MSELFLMLWAGIATGLAVYYQHKTKQLDIEIATTMFTLLMIAKGKATAKIDGDRLSVRIDEGSV